MDIEKEVTEGYDHATFILDQIKPRKKVLRWSSEVIIICILWQRCFPNGYKHDKKSKILNIPCKTTINKVAETGFSSMQRCVRFKKKMNF